MNKDIRVKYNHPAAPKDDILLNKVYSIDELISKYNYDLEYIKMAFSPLDGNWDDSIEKQVDEPKKFKSTKKDKVEDVVAEAEIVEDENL